MSNQAATVKRIRAFAEGRWSARGAGQALASFDREAWKELGRLRVPGLTVPRSEGGLGLGAAETVEILEVLGRNCRDNGLPLMLNAHLWGCAAPVAAFGGPSLRKRLLPGLCDGTLIGALAMSEPGAGSDVEGVRTRARRVGGRFLLTGCKSHVTNAPVADVFVVYARTGAQAPLTAFVVERGAPGLRREPRRMAGFRADENGGVVLENCPVVPGSILGREGEGRTVFNHSMEWERGCIMAAAAGAMARLLEECVGHANSRRQFGKAIGRFQMVLSRIADMKARIEISRALLARYAAAKDEGRGALLEAAAAKLFISEAWVRSCTDAAQILGAHGLGEESSAVRDLPYALASRIYSGTSEVQRLILARFAGLR